MSALALLALVPAEEGALDDWAPVEPALGARLLVSGDVAALVCPAPPAGAEGAPESLAARHHEVHRALLHGDVVPAPPGVVFGGDDEVRRFLTESYASVCGALSRVAGRWEFRLHVKVLEAGFSQTMALDLATHIYAELRRISAAAIPLSHPPDRVLSAAFLVERSSSGAFRTRVDELARLNAALELETTGPWPPYDFVSMRS